MDKFRTVISPKPSDWLISHQDGILMLGSCFTDNIGQRLTREKFDVSYNPLGTLFHCYAISEIIFRAVEERFFQRKAFFRQSDLWHHWALNNNWSSPDVDLQMTGANEAITALRNSLLKSKYLFLTLGTSWVYSHKESGEIVANCHKVPAANFDKICLTVEETKEILSKMIEAVNSLNPDVKIVFTVSPVRHWKDGAIENFKSKSILRSAIDLVQGDRIRYFPSYEIMMDDLRDYRFYKEDMLHPSDQAVDYIYDFFGETFHSDQTKNLNQSIKKIAETENHRALSPESESHLAFLEKTKESKASLLKEYPFLESRW